MKNINFKKQVLPHLVAILVFLLVSIIYFKPLIFENKIIEQHDVLSWRGAAQELIDYREKTGDEAIWTNSMFSGMPGYLIAVKWGNEVLLTFQTIVTVFLPRPVSIIFLCFLCFYILLLSFNIRPYLSIAGALAFGLTSYFIVGASAGHNTRMIAAAYMPLVLAGIHLTFKGKKMLGFALTALALALEIRAFHIQITYYLLFIVIVYGISEFIIATKNKQIADFFKKSGILIIAALLGIMTSIGSLLTSKEYSTFSTRGKKVLTQNSKSKEENKGGLSKEYVFQYSNGVLESMNLLLPDIVGGPSQQALSIKSETAKYMLKQGVSKLQVKEHIKKMPTYWGNQPIAAPYYAGAIIVFLFILGITVLPKHKTIWLVIVTILGIMLSLGSNFSSFNYLMFDYFPLYSKFRSVTFVTIISILAMNLLGFMALEEILKSEWNKTTKKQLGIAFLCVEGVVLILWLFSGMFDYIGAVDPQLPEWLLAPLRADRQSLLEKNALAAFFLILLTLIAIFFTLTKKIKPFIFYLSITTLIVIDHWTTDKKILNDSNFIKYSRQNIIQKTKADQFILKDKTLHYRVFNLRNPWAESTTSYYHKSIGGYHGAKFRRYQDLISNALSKEHNEVVGVLQSGSNDFSNQGVINMLNTRYIIAGETKEAVIKNEYLNGNAWFVSNVEKVDTPDEALDRTTKIDTKTTAVLNQSEFKLIKTNTLGGNGDITLTKYAPNHLSYRSKNEMNGLAVFSEIYYKDGWKASIDGKEAPIIRVNYLLRALEIPSGNHTINFVFEPTTYYWANPIVRSSSILVLLLFLGSLLIELRVILKKK